MPLHDNMTNETQLHVILIDIVWASLVPSNRLPCGQSHIILLPSTCWREHQKKTPPEEKGHLGFCPTWSELFRVSPLTTEKSGPRAPTFSFLPQHCRTAVLFKNASHYISNQKDVLSHIWNTGNMWHLREKIVLFLHQREATGMSLSPQPVLTHEAQSVELRAPTLFATDGFMYIRNCKLHNKHRHRILWTKLVLVKRGTLYPSPSADDSWVAESYT